MAMTEMTETMTNEVEHTERLRMPLVTLRDVIVFPHMTANLDIGRRESAAAVQQAISSDGYLVMLMQRDASVDAPEPADLYTVGTVVKVKQTLQLPGGVCRILAEGISRVAARRVEMAGGCYWTEAESLPETEGDYVECEAYRRAILRGFFDWLNTVKQRLPDELAAQLKKVTRAGDTADFITAQLLLSPEKRQQILECLDVPERLRRVKQLVDTEQEIGALEMKLNEGARAHMDEEQRDYFLRQKLKSIHDQLGDRATSEEEADEYREKLEASAIPEELREKVEKEIHRLESMPPMMAESAVIRNYLDWIFDLPWGVETPDQTNLAQAKKILDEDHCGLKKIKERILEYLAVRILAPTAKGSILCFVGPPGVGKTSLAKSIARAMGRKYARIALGGIHDEAEIRGHRRTYIGAMPGRFIEAISQAKSMNPLLLLDEIDKVGSDFRGDPASALLEALDPEQNKTFTDNYMDMPFDFSRVFFIATANSTQTIPPALLDRMEVVTLSGYTEEEKLDIARRHLVPRQRKQNGLIADDIRFPAPLLTKIIRGYTREAGVRELERTIGSLCRKMAKRLVLNDKNLPSLTARTVETYLGPVKFLPEAELHDAAVGRVAGLAWTAAGGVVLDTEAVALKGHGKLCLTGQLGDVMKESAEAAYTYVRSRAEALGLAADFYETLDLHIHLPEGAIPKDGPSAGITMATAMASAFTKRKVRSDTAMTGEITLSGDVLPIGGVKEKVLAASRLGLTQVLLPEKNKRDLEELPASVKEKVHFICVSHMDEVLEHALLK